MRESRRASAVSLSARKVYRQSESSAEANLNIADEGATHRELTVPQLQQSISGSHRIVSSFSAPLSAPTLDSSHGPLAPTPTHDCFRPVPTPDLEKSISTKQLSINATITEKISLVKAA